MAGGARPQTAEIIKTFGQRCPNVKVNNKPERTDYIVVLDHEGGKGFLRHRNKVAVFSRVSGDAVVSKSTLSLGASVQEACDAIGSDWSEHGAMIAAAQETSASMGQQDVPKSFEVDGSFVGSTPSDVSPQAGDHIVTVKKSGYKAWERKM